MRRRRRKSTCNEGDVARVGPHWHRRRHQVSSAPTGLIRRRTPLRRRRHSVFELHHAMLNDMANGVRSFSLSSLTTPENRVRVRPYNSLTKKPRRPNPEMDSWRKSWGPACKDEFWAALQSDYDFLMDNNLMESCKEIGRDTADACDPNREPTFTDFAALFAELYAWLSGIQEAVYSEETTLADRVAHMERLQREGGRRAQLNEQGERVLVRYPELRDEVSWRVAHINSKWDGLLLAMAPSQAADHNTDVEHQVRCLRKWLREMEGKLQPLDFRKGSNWTAVELEERAKEHLVLHRDVESHGKIVSSVIKVCDRAASPAGRQAARTLESRWHHLFLRSLEWQCHLESLAAKIGAPGASTVASSESDEEPATKLPRLSAGYDEMDAVVKPVGPIKRRRGLSRGTDGSSRQRAANANFTRSNRDAPNCATFYFKHLDTDSDHVNGGGADGEREDVDLDLQPENGEGNASTEESEDEWTYQCGGTSSVDPEPLTPEQSPSVPPSSLKRSFENIQRLVTQAEMLVQSKEEVKKKSSKYARTRQWLRMHSPNGEVLPADSCDASGEYTTEDTDEDKVSLSSEDANNCSVATYRERTLGCSSISQSGSNEGILDQDRPAMPTTPETPAPVARVTLRSKRRSHGKGERPWSVSGVLQLVANAVTMSPSLANFSISESALHQLAGSPAASSTLEESTTTVPMTGSLRKRKVRLRKRTTTRRSDSGSDGVFATPASGLVKSGSFSGTPATRRLPSVERLINSEPTSSGTLRRAAIAAAVSANPTSQLKPAVASTTETEDDEATRLPVFRLGPNGGQVSVGRSRSRSQSSDIEKLSVHSTEQASWDSYQEKYLSEPYSEDLPDPEAARRLLEFGDDYRNFLDSQSDCASSLSTNPAASSPLNRRRNRHEPAIDSDSDLEDLRNAIQRSLTQLISTEQIFNRPISTALPDVILSTDFSEISNTCKDNVRTLNSMLDSVENRTSLLSVQECRDIRGLVERWATLQARAEDLQRVRSLRREMAALRDELSSLAARVAALESDLQMADREQLEERIQDVKLELAALRDRKAQLLQVNMAVHRFLSDSGHPAALLKEDVADLYRVWDETYQRVSQQLDGLEQVSEAWHQFELHLSELQMALRSDHDTLLLLDSALRGGTVSSAVASSVRDVARVLSEKQDRQDCASGSVSDSGISDSGSDQELSERERRLAGLRRLARHLEASLAPGSRGLQNMTQCVEDAEAELRGLQRTCRDLIVRTAVCVHALSPQRQHPSTAKGSKWRRPLSAAAASTPPVPVQACFAPADPDDPDDPTAKPRHWLWRAMRAALPFQMAIMALLCVACLLEPRCCDAINNLNLSLTPQLRYVRGPPPV